MDSNNKLDRKAHLSSLDQNLPSPPRNTPNATRWKKKEMESGQKCFFIFILEQANPKTLAIGEVPTLKNIKRHLRQLTSILSIGVAAKNDQSGLVGIMAYLNIWSHKTEKMKENNFQMDQQVVESVKLS